MIPNPIHSQPQAHLAEPVEEAPYLPKALRYELQQVKEFQTYTKETAPPWFVERLQELLVANGVNLAVDGDWGPVTSSAIRRRFGSDTVGPSQMLALYAPIRERFRPTIGPIESDRGFADTLAEVAESVVEDGNPIIEIGGSNQGPWVRAFMNGRQGHVWFWCAGFVSEMLRLTTSLYGYQFPPIRGSFGCDELAGQGRRLGILRDGRDYQPEPGDIFLVGSPRDFTHTGIVVSSPSKGAVKTAEGNTNAAGSRNGDRAAIRWRRADRLWYIALSQLSKEKIRELGKAE